MVRILIYYKYSRFGNNGKLEKSIASFLLLYLS